MTDDLRAFYEGSGVDYDLFLRRLMGKETLVRKYLQLFLSDPTYTELTEAVQKHDYDTVLKKAHTLKGVAMNIELKDLSSLSADIVASIRAGKPEDVAGLFCALQKEYERIVVVLDV